MPREKRAPSLPNRAFRSVVERARILSGTEQHLPVSDTPSEITTGPMHRILIALCALFWITAAPAASSDEHEVLATVHQFIDGFNTGDTKSALAACADEVSIIDDFPPHEWHGPGSCARWASDFDADATKNGITDGIVTLGKPRHVIITSDRAYVVVPANYTYKQKGKPVKEIASRFTVTLKKGDTGWLITGWAWAQS